MKVNELFYSFQGEGIYVGTPCIFLRLSKCNFNCDFCDTNYEDYKEINTLPLSKKISNMMKEHNTDLLVITGGEPLLQYDEMKELINHLNCNIQIETNGSIINPILPNVTYIISPKKNEKLLFDFYHKYENVHFKFLIKNQEDIDLVKQLKQQYDYNETIWLQPIYEKDQQVTTLILENNIPNVKISGQLHKYLNQR